MTAARQSQPAEREAAYRQYLAGDGPLPEPVAEMPEPDTLNSLNSQSATWPVLPEPALHGLAADVVRAIEPHSEADPTASDATC